MMRRALAALLAALAIFGGLGSAARAAATTAATDLHWHSCDSSLTGWECGTLTVPRDWVDAANADTFGIAIAVHRASGRRIGTLTLNPGGPGGTSLGIADLLFGLIPDVVKRHFDVVLWDPRGVGRSGPTLTGCRVPPGLPEHPATGPVDWHRVAQRYLSESADANAACLAANPSIAPYLGTQYVVRDLEALRGALGVRRWTYWGMSYGTRIGLLYAQMYPRRLRATLLDGSVAPNDSIAEISAGMGAAHSQSLVVLASLMGKETAARLYRVIRAFDHRTYTDASGHVVTRWEFLFGVFQALRDQAALPDVVTSINEAFEALFPSSPRHVRGSSLRGTAGVAASEPDYGRLYTLRFVNCADYADRPTAEQVGDWATSSAVNGTVWAAQLTTVFASYCAGLPAFDHPMPRLTRPIRLDDGPVVLNATGDPGTPWWWARTMATYFRGSSLISYEGTAHVLYGTTPSACVNDAVTDYLVRLERPGNVVCPFAAGG